MWTSIPLGPVREALLTALVALAGCGDSDAPRVATAQGLRCEVPSVEFGEVWAGEVLRHEFELEVEREGLRVESVRADCGCTVAEVLHGGPDGERQPYAEALPLTSGTRLFVRAEYDTHGKRGHAPRAVTVYTDMGPLDLHLEATVKPWVVLEPERFDLPRTARDEVLERSFEVTSANGGRFRLEHSGRGVPDAVSVRVVPLGPDGTPLADGQPAAHWEARVTLGPDLPLGLHGYPVELIVEPEDASSWRTGEEGTLKTTGFVTVRVVGQVSLEPASVSFGQLRPGEAVARTVRLQGHDPDHPLAEPGVAVLPARPERDGALGELARTQVSAVPGENAWDIQILLEDYDGRFEGTFLGRLVVETGHPDQPSIEATISGFLPLPVAGSPAGPPTGSAPPSVGG